MNVFRCLGVLLVCCVTADVARAAELSLANQCIETAAALRETVGAEREVIVRPPFVISGNLSKESLETWHARTLEPATKAMLASYFDREPDRPITVLLYDTAEEYEAQSKQLFGHAGLSVYGYYKPNRRTLVMNIATGGGTLVHELTHALIDFDFPDVPDWFNEGLASLHEQCRFREDGAGIDGLENWRLPALQTAIRDGKLRSLEALIHDEDFRGKQVGINYAQARYFCLYLQRHELLEDYYEHFREHQVEDPQGALALKAVLPNFSWEELDKDYQNWVLELEPPR